MKEIGILKIDTLEQKHGDHLVLAYMELESLKTFCYISLKQLEILKKDFTLKTLEEAGRPTYWTKKKVLEGKKIINIGLFYILSPEQDWQLKSRQSLVSIYKKTPILELILSDKPEIFYGIKTNYSYKKLASFRMHDFQYNDKKGNPKNLISEQIKNFTKVEQLSEFIFGESSKQLNKLSLDIIFDKSKDSFEMDFSFIRFVKFLGKALSSAEIVELLKEKDRLKKSKLFEKNKWNSLFNLHDPSSSEGIVMFFKNIKEFKNKKRFLMNWNIPSHINDKFDEVMVKAYPEFKTDLDKISDPIYFYNTISRDYGRLFVEDFDIKFNNKMQPLDKVILQSVGATFDGLKSGRYTFVVPKKYSQLIKWGAELCNCAGNFDQIEYYSNGLTIGVFEGDKIVYLIDYRKEYSTPVIKQLKGFKNCSVRDVSQMDEILAPFLKEGILYSENMDELFKNAKLKVSDSKLGTPKSKYEIPKREQI